jgi:hypothetical protein
LRSLAERTGQKIDLQCQLPDLGVERLHVDRRRHIGHTAAGAEQPSSRINQLSLPGGDLVRVHIKLLRQFGQRFLALDGGQRHFCLENRGMGPAGSSCHTRS